VRKYRPWPAVAGHARRLDWKWLQWSHYTTRTCCTTSAERTLTQYCSLVISHQQTCYATCFTKYSLMADHQRTCCTAIRAAANVLTCKDVGLWFCFQLLRSCITSTSSVVKLLTKCTTCFVIHEQVVHYVLQFSYQQVAQQIYRPVLGLTFII